MIISIIIFVITLVFLMFIHELGHFLIAKKFNIKVLEFGFGIPPKIFAKKMGETLISLNLLPVGAFVRLLGEDELDKKVLGNKRSFAAQHVNKRLMVVVAGVVMNLIFAWILFYITLSAQNFKSQFLYLTDHQFLGATQTIESRIYIRGVSENSPAKSSGLKEGDRIIAVNNSEVKSSEDLISVTKNQAGEKIKLSLLDEKTNLKREVEVTPRVRPPEGEGPLGVALFGPRIVNIEYSSPTSKLLAGPIHSVNVATYSFKILGQIIGKSVEQKSLAPASGAVAGPVGITSMANTILTSSKNPLIPYLDFVALLSLNLAVFNLLPFPALDGGRAFFLAIEAIFKRKVNANIERWVHTVGMAILLTLALMITLSDIRKIFG